MPNIKVEETDSRTDETQDEEVNSRTAFKAAILLIAIISVGLLIIFALETYNERQVKHRVNAYLNEILQVLEKKEPISVNLVENMEFELTRHRDENIDNRELTDKINATLHRLQELPVFVRTGVHIRSWATSELVRTEIDSVIALYRDRNRYTIKTEYRPVTTLETRAFELQKAHPDWTKDDCLRIVNRKLWAGMSKVQLQLAWGNPRSIDKNYTFGSNSEQWVYGSMGPYVYIENGIVTSWQE